MLKKKQKKAAKTWKETPREVRVNKHLEKSKAEREKSTKLFESLLKNPEIVLTSKVSKKK